jgi:sarcosine oxidase, subunit beta
VTAHYGSAVVIGGGIIGTSAAYHLARRGLTVTVLERAAGPSQASVRNAGGIRAQCRNRTERLLAMASIELWRQFARDSGADFEYVQQGNLRMALEPATLAALAEESADEADDGLDTEVWGAVELRRRAPHLSRRFIGAKYCATDGHANPIAATWMILDAARAAGVRYVAGADVTAIDVEAGSVVGVVAMIADQQITFSADHVIHAAGAWTSRLAATVGVHLPLVPARNAMLVTQPIPPLFGEFVSSHELQVYIRQARKGHVHIGGVFTVADTFDQTVTRPEIDHLSRARDILPALDEMSILRTWSGTLDITPDHLPLIGRPAHLDGYVVAAGFSGHGFCLGPVVGKMISELVVDGSPSIDLAATHPDRFALVGGP